MRINDPLASLHLVRAGKTRIMFSLRCKAHLKPLLAILTDTLREENFEKEILTSWLASC